MPQGKGYEWLGDYCFPLDKVASILLEPKAIHGRTRAKIALLNSRVVTATFSATVTDQEARDYLDSLADNNPSEQPEIDLVEHP